MIINRNRNKYYNDGNLGFDLFYFILVGILDENTNYFIEIFASDLFNNWIKIEVHKLHF